MVVAPVETRRIRTRPESDIGNVALGVGWRVRYLPGWLRENPALTATAGALGIVPYAFGDTAEVIVRPIEVRRELGAADCGHVRIGRHLTHVGSGSHNALGFCGVQHDTRRAIVTAGDEDRLTLRRGLPDALDMIVLCVEGGVSLTSALQRVTAELQTAHPTLGLEMNVAQREMMLGLSPGEAFQKLAHRTGLDEARSLSNVLLQAERYGAGLVKALRIHADTLRHQRQQKAEEMAQKAAVKILFPTLLCIFPAIFIVILGPAAFKIAEIFSKMN